MAGEVTLAKDIYRSRLDRLFALWDSEFDKEDSCWHGLNAVALISGKQDEERATPKTDQLHLWLFGYVFPESLIVILHNRKMYFLTGPKKLNILKQLQNETTVFLDKQTPEENSLKIREIFAAVESGGGKTFRIGKLLGKNEAPTGAFAQQIESTMNEIALPEKYNDVSIDNAISLMIAIHDNKAMDAMTKSAILSVRLAKEILVVRIEDVLDNEMKETHADIAMTVEKALDDKKKQDKWKTKYNLDPQGIDIVYVNVQSGEKCDLRPATPPTKEPLNTGPGTIILAIGAKYVDFTSNIARTLLFNASKEKKQSYQAACDTIDYAISLLIPGMAFNDVYEKIREHVNQNNPKLSEYLTRSFGHTLSIEFRESSLTLNGKSNTIIVPGMVFNISVGFGNIPTEDGKTKYSIWLADTVLVKPEGEKPVILTSEMDRKFKSVNYELEDQPSATTVSVKQEQKKTTGKTTNSGEGKTNPVPSKKPTTNSNIPQPQATPSSERKNKLESVVLRDRLRSRNKASSLEESEKLLERQNILRKRKVDEICERFKDGANFTTNKRSVRKMTSIVTYRDPNEFPRDLKPNRIHLDLMKEAVLVPIPNFGHVPFNISTIRNVFCQAEDKKYYILRIQFQVPGSIGFGYKADANPFPDISGPHGMYIKELIFRSANPQVQQTFKSLKDLQKRIKQREETGDRSQDIAFQAPIELNRKSGKRVLLKSVMVKTGTQTRRTAGTLESHLNGLRFQGGRVDVIDINYANIKHALFQPCENELLVLIHFHLKNPILVNKKKATDIQFYTEVGSQTDDLDQHRGRSTYDPDEIGEEQRERELRKRLNIEFKRFVEATEEIAKSNGEHLEFDLPQRELAFHGVPKNSSQLMLPTSKCLVQLSEWPVFILTLSEIEIVSFERIFHGLRQFDMVFIFKDYTKSVQQITTIPIESLDSIKRWLNEIDVVWYESRGNLNWTEILRTIREDIEGFLADGGFEIFLGEEGGGTNVEKGEDSESDEEDEEYNGASSEDLSDFSDDAGGSSSENSGKSDDEESLASEGSLDGSDGYELDSEEEEGLSWDELEQRAIKEDRKKGHGRSREDEDDSDDDGHRRKKRRK